MVTAHLSTIKSSSIFVYTGCFISRLGNEKSFPFFSGFVISFVSPTFVYLPAAFKHVTLPSWKCKVRGGWRNCGCVVWVCAWWWWGGWSVFAAVLSSARGKGRGGEEGLKTQSRRTSCEHIWTQLCAACHLSLSPSLSHRLVLTPGWLVVWPRDTSDKKIEKKKKKKVVQLARRCGFLTLPVSASVGLVCSCWDARRRDIRNGEFVRGDDARGRAVGK